MKVVGGKTTAMKPTITGKLDGERNHKIYDAYIEEEAMRAAEDPIVKYMSKEQLQKSIENTKALMLECAKNLDFLQAAQYRDELIRLEAQLEAKL